MAKKKNRNLSLTSHLPVGGQAPQATTHQNPCSAAHMKPNCAQTAVESTL